jgi:hypothetical protein
VLSLNAVEVAIGVGGDGRSGAKVLDGGVQVSRNRSLHALAFAVPILVLALAALHLVLRGHDAVAVVAANLPPPPNSVGPRLVDLVHPTSPQGRIYVVEVRRSDDPQARKLDGARVQLNLASLGRTHVLLVAQNAHDASRLRGLLEVLRGRASLQVVDDRGWVDLGPLPAGGGPLRALVTGLLPGDFGFAQLDDADLPAFESIDIRLAKGERPVVRTAPRYRVVRPAPVPARETLARLLFFVAANRLVLACTFMAVVALCIGWQVVAGEHPVGGVLLLVLSTVLLHATLLPPLQGADETSQVGTIEWIVSDPSPSRIWRYPESVALVTRVLEQDRVQFHPREPLPLAGPAARAWLRDVLRAPLTAERTQAAPPPPAADLQVTSWRAPLFYAAYRAGGDAFAKLSVGDRIFAYRLLAAASGIAGMACGLALLGWARVPVEVALACGLAPLLPYVGATLATCSNYAPAIGLGFLCAAGIVATVLGGHAPARRAAAATTVAGAWIGVTLWPDMLALALAATIVFVVAAARVMKRRAPPPGQDDAQHGGRLVPATVALVVAAVGVTWWYFPGIDARLTAPDAAWRDTRLLPLRVTLVAAPLVAAVVAAIALRRLARAPLATHRFVARTASAAFATLLLLMFLVTPYAEVPYEQTFLPLPELLHAHLNSFWASNFAFDQDRLGWKFLFGTFGWHDTYYPEAVYAVARWVFVALLISLPVLTLSFARRRPDAATVLVLVCGAGLAFCVASLLVRHAMTVHPHGRFILPWLPLVTSPLLALLATQRRRRALVFAARALAALDVWTAVAVLGTRYVLQT